MWPDFYHTKDFGRDLKKRTYTFQCKMAGKHRRKK